MQTVHNKWRSGRSGVDHKSRSRVEAYERATLMSLVEATCHPGRAYLFFQLSRFVLPQFHSCVKNIVTKTVRCDTYGDERSLYEYGAFVCQIEV